MKPVRTKDAAPGQYVTVPGVVHKQSTTWSYWRPSFWERLAVLTGRPIRLSVFGAGVVFIDTEE